MHIKHAATAMPWRPVVTAVALSLLLVTSAKANFVSPVTLNLIAPGGTTGNATPVSETASVDPATGLHAGDAGSLISSFWMLSNESITFGGNSILLHLVAGAGDSSTNPPVPYTTGYLGLGGNHARYEFAGLAVPGSIITGYSYTTPAGILSGGNVSLVSANQLNFDLDTLVFDTALNQRTNDGYYYADFKIDLLTQPIVSPPGGTVPEPAGWVLVLGALGALRLSVRRKPGHPAR